jgi:hypothetical protein
MNSSVLESVKTFVAPIFGNMIFAVGFQSFPVFSPPEAGKTR